MQTHSKRLILVVASALVLASAQVACTAQSDEPVSGTEEKIVGGTIVPEEGTWPGAVAVYKGSTSSPSFSCGGSLVAPQWVLTAGHCVTASSPTGGFTKIVAGRNKLSGASGENITEIDKGFRHAQYNASTHDFDIALIHLKNPAHSPIGKLVRPTDLAQITDGMLSKIVGWGTTSAGGSVSNDLREVEVPVITNDKCKQFPRYNNVPDSQICAITPGGGHDSCQGDSGGPLYLKFGTEYRQVGLTSWGIGCAGAQAPGVYTRVGTYLTWLKEQSNGEIVVEEAPPAQ